MNSPTLSGSAVSEKASLRWHSPVASRFDFDVDDVGAPGVAAAVAQARAAFVATRSQSRAWRIERLHALKASLQRLAPVLESLIVSDIGKPRKAARHEVQRCIGFVGAVAAQLQTLGGETLALDAASAGAAHMGYTVHKPYGVIAAITPFNAPLNLLVQKVVPALAMGNAVIAKPHPAGTRVAQTLLDGCREASLSEGLFQVLTGDKMAAQLLVEHPDVSVVTFTGGVAAGEALARRAGAKKFVAELGSNAANVVLADANLDVAAHKIAAAAFEASGQQCVSAQRVIVETSVFDAFADRFCDAARALRVGNPEELTTDIGPMISEAAAARTLDLWRRSAVGSARVLLEPRQDGAYVSPGILADARGGPLWCEEAFGPLAVLQRADGVEHALELANDSPFGLQGALFTRNLDAMLDFADRFEVGALWINEASRFRLDSYPFGGAKASGFGREGVRFAMEEMSQLKFVGICHS